MNHENLVDLEGWLPADVIVREDGIRIAWTLRGREPLPASSFEQTLQHQMAKPFHQLFRRETSLEEMAAWVEEHPPAPLRGMIFHTGHCGAQELSGHFAKNRKNRVASQPTPLDGLLRIMAPDLPHATKIRCLKAMVGALGQPQADEEAFFLLLHPWHIHSVDLFREAFPETPWIFLFDEPVVWLESIQRNPPMWTIPSLLAPEALRLEQSDWQPGHTEIYAARALATMYRAALDATREDPRGLLINRSAEVEAMYGRVAKHFGLGDNERVLLQTADAAPMESTHLRDVANEYLQGLYEELEAQRTR